MKNLLTIISIALISTTVFAGAKTQNIEVILDPIDSKISTLPEFIASKDQVTDSNLWEILDSDKDGFISKTEATFSQSITDKWESLDSNKDEKLDTAEFSQAFTQKN